MLLSFSKIVELAVSAKEFSGTINGVFAASVYGYRGFVFMRI